MTRVSDDRFLSAVTVLWALGLLVSGWQPFDRATWWMEVAPVLIALPILWLTRRRFRLTRLALLSRLHDRVLARLPR